MKKLGDVSIKYLIGLIKTKLEDYMPKSGGTFTGDISGKYITGTWLRTTAASDLNKAPSRYPVLNDGWLYYRTSDEMKADLGISGGLVSAFTEITSDGVGEIDIPISITDISQLTVYYDGLLLVQGVNYIASATKITLVGFTAGVGDMFIFIGSPVAGSTVTPIASNVTVEDTGNLFPSDVNSVEGALKHLKENLPTDYISASMLDSRNYATKSEVETAITSKGYLTQHQDISGLLPKSGGTMTGKLVAQNNTNYTTKQIRNIYLIKDGDTVPTGANGDICIIYKE